MKTLQPADIIARNLMELQKFYWDQFKGEVTPILENINKALYEGFPEWIINKKT